MKQKKKTVDHLVQDYCLTCQDQTTAVRPTDASLVTVDSLLQGCLCDLSEPDNIIPAIACKTVCLTCQDWTTSVSPTDSSLTTVDSLLPECQFDLSELENISLISEPDYIRLVHGPNPYYDRQSPERLSA